jgi:hypothetical protein
LESSFVVTFPFDKVLPISEANAFEIATVKWIESYPLGTVGSVDHLECDVFNQIVKTTTSDEGGRRVMETFIEIFFLVKGEYTGSDNDFVIFDWLDSQFQAPNVVWTRFLADEDTFFQDLVEDTVPDPDGTITGITGNDPEGQTSLSKSSYSGILVISFLALILAVVASVYAVRSHNLNTFGTELRSPVSHMFTHGKTDLPTTESNNSFIMHQLTESSSGSGEHVGKTKRTTSKNSPRRQSPRAVQLQQAGPPPPPPPPSQQQHRNPRVVEQPSKTANTLYQRRPNHVREPEASRADEKQAPEVFSEVNFGRESSLFDRVRTTLSETPR